ncbi:MAG: carboxypeptidase-like regulatory domain-containing protein [Bacteroides intestinalis]|nr:carboxypeptidase-like regulatory domain-containing protein [Bacteroides intestinalis]
MRYNTFIKIWKNHHRCASIILGLSLLSAPLSYPVYAEDGVSNAMVQIVTQTKTVKGTVVDESGEPLIGVSILVKGTNTGAITDFNGHLSIDLPAEKKELVISYIGYKEQIVTVTGNAPIHVKMMLDTQALDEIVVIGYGAVKKNVI